MLIKSFKGSMTALILVLSAVLIANTAEPYKLVVQSANIRMDGLANKGESSQHDWDATYTQFNMDTDFAFRAAPKDALGLFSDAPQMKKFVLTINVENFSTTKSPGFMFKKYYYESMKFDDHKSIVFTASKNTAIPDRAAKNKYIISMTGTLKVAGVEKPVVIDLIATATDKTITFSGVKIIDMADFGIKPPKMDFPKKSYVDSKATLKWVIVASIAKK